MQRSVDSETTTRWSLPVTYGMLPKVSWSQVLHTDKIWVHLKQSVESRLFVGGLLSGPFAHPLFPEELQPGSTWQAERLANLDRQRMGHRY